MEKQTQIITKEQIQFSQDQVNLIKSQIAPKATDTELQLFLYQAKRTGLDPLTRQIYCIHRKVAGVDKMTIQTSIDGFRVIAERSGDYAGQGEPSFEEQDGKLIKCKISIYRFNNGIRYEAAVGVAYWDEYVVTKDEYINNQKTGKKIPSDMWAKMPHAMLAKVAEALALRKAYPQDLSGLYTTEEMAQADYKEPAEDIQHETMSDIDLDQWKDMLKECKDKAELTKLYKSNKQVVDNNEEIFKLFSFRKTELLNAEITEHVA